MTDATLHFYGLMRLLSSLKCQILVNFKLQMIEVQKVFQSILFLICGSVTYPLNFSTFCHIITRNLEKRIAISCWKVTHYMQNA